MASILGLPDLNRNFCNFELGIDAEHVRITDIPNDGYELLKESFSQTPPTTLPPNIQHSNSSNDDSDIDIDCPSNMKGLRRRQRRSKRNKQALINRNKNNNPNPFSKTHKGPTTDQYTDKYKKCPWKQINVERSRMSFDECVVDICIDHV